MEYRILRTKQVKDLVKQFKDNGYQINTDDGNFVVTDDEHTVFRALQHSSRTNYLVCHTKGLLEPA